MDETGFFVNGKHYECDLIIWCTGFDMFNFLSKIDFPIVGRGESLREKWGNGLESLFGTMIHGFPNLFLLQFGQAAFSPNFARVLDDQSGIAAHVISSAVKRGAKTVEVSSEAEQKWTAAIARTAQTRVDFFTECTPS